MYCNPSLSAWLFLVLSLATLCLLDLNSLWEEALMFFRSLIFSTHLFSLSRELTESPLFTIEEFCRSLVPKATFVSFLIMMDVLFVEMLTFDDLIDADLVFILNTGSFLMSGSIAQLVIRC